MKINFLLPTYARAPVGGFKVVFEYANRLAADGKIVRVIYPVIMERKEVLSAPFSLRWKMVKKSISKQRGKRFSAKVWFPLHPAVKEKLVPNLKDKFIPDADITIATAWETSVWLYTYGPSKGRPFYLIQHYEEWNTTPMEVDKSWRFPFTKIVIARWLQNHATALGESSVLVHNGLDFQKFTMDTPPTDRNPYQLIMIYHVFDWKRSAIGLAALEIAKKEAPQLEAVFFSTFEQPADLPSWVSYRRNPGNLKELYNQSAIFLSCSQGEGWALPPAEAMQCGCAVIASDVGGHQDYGENEKDLLLVPVDDVPTIAATIVRLIKDQELRISIANNGHKAIQQFTWGKAYDQFKAALLR